MSVDNKRCIKVYSDLNYFINYSCLSFMSEIFFLNIYFNIHKYKNFLVNIIKSTRHILYMYFMNYISELK